ncbi:peptidase M24 [Trametes meyenii]|nr:peptidase M24 [Trametes meyenii]
MVDKSSSTEKSGADVSLGLAVEEGVVSRKYGTLPFGPIGLGTHPRRLQIRHLIQLGLWSCLIYFFWQLLHSSNWSGDFGSVTPDFSYLASHCSHISPIPLRSFIERQDSLARTLHTLNASAYIAEPGASAGYFANLSSSHWGLSERPLLLIVQPSADPLGNIRANISILTPAFEETRAKLLPIPSAAGVTYAAWPEDHSPFSQALSLVPTLTGATIYVDGNVRTFIADGLQKAAPQVAISAAPVQVRRLRERKSPEEIKILKCVNEATVLAIRAARVYMRIGMRESEAGQLIRRALAASGLTGGFALTLFGENAALPHGSGSDRVLGNNDFILIDTGGTLHGYHSDVTRTFALPETIIPLPYLKLWDVVHSAQQVALASAINGTITQSVDRAARKVIAEAGYGKYFTHRLGHGIGLETHESPYLVGGSEDVILTGHTFSDEPGIYIEGEIGIRLEDCFFIDEDGVARYLTAAVGGPALSPWSP